MKFIDKKRITIFVSPEEMEHYDKIYFESKMNYPSKVNKNDILAYALRRGIIGFEDKTKEAIDVILQNKTEKN